MANGIFKGLSGVLILATGQARADVVTVAQTFLDVCPATVFHDVSPATLGLAPLREEFPPTITKELIAQMPDTFWQLDTDDGPLLITVFGWMCTVSGPSRTTHQALKEFKTWLVEDQSQLTLTSVDFIDMVDGSGRGAFVDLCFSDPVTQTVRRATASIGPQLEGGELSVTLNRYSTCAGDAG